MAAIFQVKSPEHLKMSGRNFAHGYFLILLVMLVFLIVWTALERPLAVWRRTSGDLKFLDCHTGWWGHGVVIGECYRTGPQS